MALHHLLALKKSTKPKGTFEGSGETLHLLAWRDHLVHVAVVGGRSYDETATLEVTLLTPDLATVATTALPETRRFHVKLLGDDLLIFAARKTKDDRALVVVSLTKSTEAPKVIAFPAGEDPVALDDTGHIYTRDEDALVVFAPPRDGANELARLPIAWDKGEKGFRDLAIGGSRLLILGPRDYTGLKLIDIANPRSPQLLHSFGGKFNAPDRLVRVGTETYLAYGVGDKAHVFRIEGDKLVSGGTVGVGDRYQRAVVEGDSALLFGGYKKGERGVVVRAGAKPEKVGTVTFADSLVSVVLTDAGALLATSDGVSAV